jgi:hypothetical protein
MAGPVPYRSVDLSALTYGDITKDVSARLYVVPIVNPVTIQTTPVTLKTTLEDPDIPFVYIEPDASLKKFLQSAEKTVEDACVTNKQTWFAASKHLEDDVLRRGFKSFFSDTGFKVKVPADIPCFDASKKPIGREDVPAGGIVRLVLELSRVCFGKHEYGITWKATQAQIVPSVCLIDDTVNDEIAAIEDHDSDINEFL